MVGTPPGNQPFEDEFWLAEGPPELDPTRTKSRLARLVALAVASSIVFVFPSEVVAQERGGPGPIVRRDVKHDTSPPLREIRPGPSRPRREVEEKPLPKALREGPEQTPRAPAAPVVGRSPSNPTVSFNGISNVDFTLPPDTNGDVGPNHYVQMVNVSYAIFNKSGTLLMGPLDNNTLFQGFGGPCEDTNDGDPIVLYDHLEDRWLLSQFALPDFPTGTFYQCIAISATEDPTGSYHRYQFVISETKMNDYPKLGVWPDGYYMSVNQFNEGTLSWGGAGAVVFERDQMLIGGPADMVYFDLFGANQNFGGQLPSDLDGPAPPAGTPNYFAEVDDSTWIPPTDALRIWEFHVDWVTPSNSTFGIGGQPNQTITVAGWVPLICGPFGNPTLDCVDQPSPGPDLDGLQDRLMHRLQYRNFGTHQVLMANHTVEVGTNQAAVRWYELRKPSTWSINQQGTYAPDSTHRWMGSVAMDGDGNIALGYSASSNSVPPSIRYAGRLKTDPAGTLGTERTLTAGTGVQNPGPEYGPDAGHRWGDYSMMAVDPTDDCTFWYTNEYYLSNGSNWQTRVGAFSFDWCTADLSVVKTDSPDPVQAGNTLTYNITVTNSGPLTATNTVVTDTLSPAVSFVSAIPSQGSCGQAADTVTCTLGTINSGSNATVAIQVTPNSSGTITNTVTVDAAQPDPDPSNNTDLETTTVPGTLSQITLSPASDTNPAGTTHNLNASVTDGFANPVANGTVVTFTVTGLGAQVATSTTSGGQATFGFLVTQVGSSTITASAQGETSTVVSNVATKTWHHAPPASVVVSPPSGTNVVGTAHTVTAVATDSFGNAIASHPATLTVTGPGATTTPSTTNGSGVVTFTFSSTQPGTSFITVTVSSNGSDASGAGAGSASGSATKTWNPGGAAQVTLAPATSTNEVGATHTVTATVKDQFGNNVANGTVVTFTVAGTGGESPTGSTAQTVGGKASFAFSSSQKGTSTVTATAGSGLATAKKVWFAPPASISLDPSSDSNQVGTTHTVTATVLDEFADPVDDGTPVNFSVAGTGFESPSGATVMTSGGEAVFSFSSTKTGTSKITATSGSISETATKNWTPKPPAAVSISPSTDVNLVGTTHTVTATVVDQFGNNVANGTNVTFTAAGTGAESPPSGNSTTTGGKTNFSFSSAVTGTSNITATAGGVFGTATKQWVNPPATITLIPASATNGAGTSHTVTATVLDQFGSPVADGTVVTFTVTGAGSRAATATTNNGKALLVFTSTLTGSSTITATVAGATQTFVSNAVTKTWHHGAPAQVPINPSAISEFEGNTVTFVATATDAFGNPIASHNVAVSTNFGVLSTQSATTDGAGRATFSVYSTTTGVSSITVTVSSNGADASGAGAGSASGNATLTWVSKRYTPLPPARILDTRSGSVVGTCTPSPCATIPAGGQIEVQVRGADGVPSSGVSGVIMNATVDGPTHPGFLTIFPKGQPQPVVSNLNFVPGEIRANLASVKVGDDGRVMAYNGSSGPLNVIFDAAGWYSDASEPIAGGSFLALSPDRLLDTRDGTGQPSAGAIPAGGTITLTVEGEGSVPASGVAAAVLNVTVDKPSATGFLTVHPSDESRPLASNVNFTPGLTIPNLSVIKLSSDGEVAIYNGSSGPVHVVADVAGIYSDPVAPFGGGAHEAIAPQRILDTRDGTGGFSTPIPANSAITVDVTGVGGLPASGAQAVVLNVTVDQPTAAGFLTVYPAGETRPLASNLNFTPGRPVPNLVKVKVGAGGAVTIFNGSPGTVHVIFDAAGWFRPILT